MESKALRIAELEKQILEIKKEKDYNYALIKVIPDCGAGIKDDEDILIISTQLIDLITYCEERFDYTPKMGRERDKNDGRKSHCDAWYKIDYTPIEII
jgi:hypothetical protein